MQKISRRQWLKKNGRTVTIIVIDIACTLMRVTNIMRDRKNKLIKEIYIYQKRFIKKSESLRERNRGRDREKKRESEI